MAETTKKPVTKKPINGQVAKKPAAGAKPAGAKAAPGQKKAITGQAVANKKRPAGAKPANGATRKVASGGKRPQGAPAGKQRRTVVATPKQVPPSKKYIDIIIPIVFICGLLIAYASLQEGKYPDLSVTWQRVIDMVVNIAFLAASVIVMSTNNERAHQMGFIPENHTLQMGYGAIVGILLSLTTLGAVLAGYGGLIDPGRHYTTGGGYVYEFFFSLLAVAVVREFTFRGFFYERIMKVKESSALAIIVSSLLYGMFFITTENYYLVGASVVVGLVLSICKAKIRLFTTFSCIIAQFIYSFASVIMFNTLM